MGMVFSCIRLIPQVFIFCGRPQQWIKVDSWGLKFKDKVGYTTFSLVNKVTRHALKHGDKEWDHIYLAYYNYDKTGEVVL